MRNTVALLDDNLHNAMLLSASLKRLVIPQTINAIPLGVATVRCLFHGGSVSLRDWRMALVDLVEVP